MKKKVSIIIPVYNGGKYIKKCLDSIEEQVYKNIEVIVIDDGSIDDSRKIIYESRQRLEYIYQENAGVSVARNRGIEASTGDYIAFIDADDWIEKNYIDELVDCIEQDNSEYSFCDWIVEKSNSSYVDILKKNLPRAFNAEELYRFYLINRCGCAPWAKLFRRNIIIENNLRFFKGLPYAEDYLFILEYLSYCQRVSYINKALIHYNCYEIGAGDMLRENYFELQIQIEKLKERIVLNSKKYLASDKDLLKISKIQVYVKILEYLRKTYKHWNQSKKRVEEICKMLSSETKPTLVKSANLTMKQKILARLAFSKKVTSINLIIYFMRWIGG